MERDPTLVTLESDLAAVVARIERGEVGQRQLWAVIDLLVDILEHRNLLSEGHRRVIGRLRRSSPVQRPPVRLYCGPDKYTIEGAAIDCAARLDQCLARCCALEVELGRQDLDERRFPWRLDEPYVLTRDEDGYCTNLDRRTGLCRDYEHRPARCREFDCRRDERIWVDFEANLAAPPWQGLAPPGPGRGEPRRG
jgi:hypothetical protein